MLSKLKYWMYRLQFNHPELFNHKPIHLDLELVRACNLKCPFCYRQEKGFEDKFKPAYMAEDKATDYLVSYWRKGFRSIKFNWRGEPLLHPQIGYLANAAKELGYLDRMINTNLACKLSADFLENLDSFTEIRVSLDTVNDKLYAKMRTPAKLETVLGNMKVLINKHNPKKTRLIIQRRTTSETESDSQFKGILKSYFYSDEEALFETAFTSGDHLSKLHRWEEFITIISKPVQPRVKFEMKYENSDKPLNLNLDGVSYYDQWKAGLIERQYCKQPSQRVVVGVDGKEWACCLAYNEDRNLSREGGNAEMLINRLINGYELYIPDVCYKCTSFSAYRGK